MEQIKILSVSVNEQFKTIHLYPEELDSCISTEIGGRGISTETVVTNGLLNKHLDNDNYIIYSREDGTDLKINAAASSLAPDSEGCFGQVVICKMIKTAEGYKVTGLENKEISLLLSAMGIWED